MEDVSLMPPEERKIHIYDLYKILFHSSFPEYKKIEIIKSLFLWEPWSWRVVGITTNAIYEFKNNDFKYKIGTFNRDHFIQDRQITIQQMTSNLMPYKEWWEWFWENDQTRIVTKKEHNRKSSRETSKVVKVDWNLGFFVCKKRVGFSYSKKREGEYLKTLIKENNLCKPCGEVGVLGAQ